MFLENKYTNWYFKIIENAKTKERKKKTEIYYESHHIIPKSMGGTEEVLLTAKEHFICHLLLCKMTSGSNKHKMINAIIKLSFSKSEGQKRYTANSYSLVRKMIAEKNSQMFKGVPKSELVKQNMKGRSGTWKRNEIHKMNYSTAQKKRFLDSENPFKGKKHSGETKKKWSEMRKGVKPTFNAKGSKWYTNGVNDKMCFPDSIPEGYYPGRMKIRKEVKNELAT